MAQKFKFSATTALLLAFGLASPMQSHAQSITALPAQPGEVVKLERTSAGSVNNSLADSDFIDLKKVYNDRPAPPEQPVQFQSQMVSPVKPELTSSELEQFGTPVVSGSPEQAQLVPSHVDAQGVKVLGQPDPVLNEVALELEVPSEAPEKVLVKQLVKAPISTQPILTQDVSINASLNKKEHEAITAQQLLIEKLAQELAEAEYKLQGKQIPLLPPAGIENSFSTSSTSSQPLQVNSVSPGATALEFELEPIRSSTSSPKRAEQLQTKEKPHPSSTAFRTFTASGSLLR